MRGLPLAMVLSCLLAVPALADLDDDIRARILEVQEKAGFVPNVFLTLAHRPQEFRAFFAYHDALMEKEGGGLTKAEREMIVVATSGANDCLYCVVAHGAILRIYAKNPRVADQVGARRNVHREGEVDAAEHHAGIGGRRAQRDAHLLAGVQPDAGGSDQGFQSALAQHAGRESTA